MIRNVLGSVLALAGAAAAVLSPFRDWYDGRPGPGWGVAQAAAGGVLLLAGVVVMSGWPGRGARDRPYEAPGSEHPDTWPPTQEPGPSVQTSTLPEPEPELYTGPPPGHRPAHHADADADHEDTDHADADRGDADRGDQEPAPRPAAPDEDEGPGTGRPPRR
ncbi:MULTISPECIES: hypothetical protein [unclassified Streptomyces]|uniref:hypothetical protein n=1 Tax=unclassified Streptomyces TaxID=2593676 RepID=UPI0021CC9174|nr:hypothetical protein [Streptomyces sp. sk2.1]